MKCNNCKVDLDCMTIKVEGKFKRIWMHPDLPASKDCPNLNHGLKVSIEVTDAFLNDKFQEEIESQPKNGLEDVKEETKALLSETNEEKIKRRIAEGEISIEDFDRTKERLELKWN